MDRRGTEPKGRDERFRVLIAGGGVAGLEAVLCLRELLRDTVSIELLSGGDEFVYQPLAPAEPFGLGEVRRMRLDRFADEQGTSFHQDLLSSVNAKRRSVLTESGRELGYDALLLGIGVHHVVDLPGSLVYGGAESNRDFGELLAQLEMGEFEHLVFAVPATVRWALPLYELALLTAHHLAERGADGVSLAVVSPEARPLEMFGRRASDSVAALLAGAGVDFRGPAAPSAVEDSHLVIANGERIAADRVVTLPRLEVPLIPGVPQGPRGFIGANSHMQVEGLGRVYAAGDATWFPVKQGGIAAQQADVAATSIASLVDPEIERIPFRPVLRGALITGSVPRYLRSEVGDRGGSSASGAAPLWWPPSKIAARHLAPYMERREDPASVPLDDLPPLHGEDVSISEQDHRDAVDLALSAADADARWHDYRTALRWLEIAEQLNLTLPPAYASKRQRWREASRG